VTGFVHYPGHRRLGAESVAANPDETISGEILSEVIGEPETIRAITAVSELPQVVKKNHFTH
jgi:hypothetical protein